MKNLRQFLIFAIWIAAAAGYLTAKDPGWTLDLESGLVVPGYNDVQIPNNDSATRFSLKDDLGIDSKAYYRLRLSYQLGQRHELSLLYAPLSLKAEGILKKPVNYQDARFEVGTTVNGVYRFNSYRLSYRYRLVDKTSLSLWLGFTAKIRDAEIKLQSIDQVSSRTNVGFVPLLHLYLDWQWGNRWGMILEADALAAKQGRAEDVAAIVYYRLTRNVRFKIGYRFVEGGSNGDEVYNFAFINYVSAGMILNFR
jgi:hypothetical protein